LDGYALLVKKLKGTDPVETLDLSRKHLGVASLVVIASLISVNGALTVTNLLGNQLDAESAKMLAEVAKQKGLSLCGIQRDQTAADFRNKRLQPPDAILLASDLSQAVVTGALTSISLANNMISGIGGQYSDGSGKLRGAFSIEGIVALADALSKSMALRSVDLSNNSLAGVNRDGHGTFRSEGINLIADAIRVIGALTAMNLSSNCLKDEGVSVVCAAIQSNKETKLASLNFGDNDIGPVGANAVAAMVAVTGALTQVLAF
jgi:Ran GTPase-activating protein (RanGAP) involved in mRNA processing and transport